MGKHTSAVIPLVLFAHVALWEQGKKKSRVPFAPLYLTRRKDLIVQKVETL